MELKEALRIGGNMSLKEMAAKALAEKKAKEEMEAREAFKRVFECEPESVEGSIIHYDGMVLLHYRYDEKDNFRLQGKCPKCGQEVWAGDFDDYEGLGEQLAEFDPDWHDCPPKPEFVQIGDFAFKPAYITYVKPDYYGSVWVYFIYGYIEFEKGPDADAFKAWWSRQSVEVLSTE